jgi:hypothetical protein
MTGDDFLLDVNDPAYPKLLTIGSNPQKMANFELVRAQVEVIVQEELQRIGDAPEMGHLVL